MLKVLRRLVRTPLITDEGALQARVTVKGEVLRLDKDELERIRDQVLAAVPMNRGRAGALEQVVARLKAQVPDDVDVEPAELDELIRDHPSLVMFMNAWWPTLHAPEVLARLADVKLLERVAPQLSTTEHAAVAESYGWLGTEGAEIHGWSVADMALLDELMHMLGPAPVEQEDIGESVYIEMGDDITELVTIADQLRSERVEEDLHSTYAHVLVDEAQDVTPMQWRMIRRRGPQASWTLVGDPAQSSFPQARESEAAMKDLVGRSQLRRFTLSTNYRSPKEIFNLAAAFIARVVPDADLPDAVRSTGLIPEVATTTPDELVVQMERHLIRLAGQVSGTVAVIAPRSRYSEIQRATLASDRLSAFDARLIVVTPLQAKGLEYDGVLVLSPDEIVAEAPGAERVLYVALTRATQRMVTLDVVGQQWREGLDPDLYRTLG